MFFELIAAILAGVAAAGVVLLLNKILGGRLPKWLTPAAAGAAMIGFTILMEYTWFDRTTGEFPESVIIANTHEARNLWRPWTFAVPLIDSFVAVDPASMRTNADVPDQRMADLLYFERWRAPRSVPMVFDCVEGRAAPLLDTVTYDDKGAVDGAAWVSVPTGDPTLATICKEI